MLTEADRELALKCISVYIGDYSVERQYASSIILKMLFKERYRELMSEIKEMTGFKVNDRNSSKVVTWKKKVKAKGKCEICGATEKLEAHHVVPWEYSITGRTDVSNGMCLCKECHKMMHDDVKWLEYKMGEINGRKENGQTD